MIYQTENHLFLHDEKLLFGQIGCMNFGVWHDQDSSKVGGGGETKAVVLVTLGFITFVVKHKLWSGKAGHNIFEFFSNERGHK